MKYVFLAFTLALCIVGTLSCDDSSTKPEGGGGPPNTSPVPTAPGVPAGVAAMGDIGAGGGALASADGLFRLDVPPGALATTTSITIQPITNTAWGGVGRAYRLTPDGLTFNAPVSVVFSLEDSLLAGTDTSFVHVAVQRDDGVWGVLAVRDVDMGAGTITCRTSHFSDYSLVHGTQIRPAAALVNVNQSIALHVQFCSQEVIQGEGEGEEDLVALINTCDDELAPLGTFANWSVNGAIGGNSVVGTVGPTDGHRVTYTAPDEEPTPNQVAVSVRTHYYGSEALLVCNITIVGTERWTGSTTSYQGGDIVEATVTWVEVGTFKTLKFFEPTGSVEYTIDPSNCDFVSLDPDTWPIGETDGTLLIDYGQDPPTFVGAPGRSGTRSIVTFATPKRGPNVTTPSSRLDGSRTKERSSRTGRESRASWSMTT